MTAPLRVLQVCADRGIAPGSTKGAAQHLRGIAAGFDALGHSVVTYAQRRPEGDFPVEVRPLSELQTQVAGSFDVVYERYSLGHRGGLRLARTAGVPFVLEVNAPLVDEATKHRPGTVQSHHGVVEDELFARAELVSTVSRPLTQWVRDRRRGPTITLSNGFEPSWFQEPATNPQYPLVFLGHPKPWHGANRLPLMLRELRRRGHAPDLLVVGGGPGAEDLRQSAELVGVAEQLTITGALPGPDATALLAEAAIGLAPYPPHENFYFCPLKIIDYLAAGLAVVATDQGDIASLVNGAGFVVDPTDQHAFVDAVERLLVDPSRRAAFGRSGSVRAATELSWIQVASRTAEAIRAVLAEDQVLTSAKVPS